MRTRWLVSISAVIAVGSLAVVAERATAGGTAVAAAADLDAAACEQGVHPRILGVRQKVAPKVIGCAALSDGDEVLVAADSDGRHACFYAALTGGEHVDGPCIRVGPATRPTGGARVEALSVREPEGGSGAYFGGVVPSDIAHAFLRYRTADGDSREWPARLIRVHERLARQLGARPFAYFVGEIPSDADTCRGLLVEGRGKDAALLADQPLSERTVLADGVALPGSKDCDERGAAGRSAGSIGATLGAAVPGLPA